MFDIGRFNTGSCSANDGWCNLSNHLSSWSRKQNCSITIDE